MKLIDELEQLLLRFKRRPGRTTALVVVGLIVVLGGFVAKSYLSEVGKNLAVPHDTVTSGGSPELRVQFHLLEGPTVLDRALRGYGFSEADGFISKPYWVKNEVFDYLRSVLRALEVHRSSGNFPYDSLEITARSASGNLIKHQKLEAPPSDTIKAEGELKPFVGALRDDRATRLFDERTTAPFVTPSWLLSQLESSPFWTIKPTAAAPMNSGGQILKDAEFFGIVPAALVRPFVEDPLSKRLLAVHRDINDLVFVSVTDSHGSYTAKIIPRELQMLVVDIENIGAAPIRLAGYKRRLTAGGGELPLRGKAEVEDSQGHAVPQEVAVPLDALAPKEHLFIPLSLRLGFATTLKPDYIRAAAIQEADLPDRWWQSYPSDPVEFELVRGLAPDGNAITSTHQITKQALMSKFDFRANTPREYYLGPIIDVDAVSYVGGSGAKGTHVIRRFNPTNLLIRGGDAKGSCPILYRMKDSEWKRVRPVLVDAVSKSRESLDELSVSSADTRFLLREEEFETSYVDFVGLRITLPDGRVLTLPPVKNGQLAKRDGNYVALQKGQEIELRFEVPPSVSGIGERTLLFAGYYVPDSLRRRQP